MSSYSSPSLPALDWQLPSCSGPYNLQIEVQPKSHHRAHYETEGSRGAVKALSGGHPVVQVCQQHCVHAPGGFWIISFRLTVHISVCKVQFVCLNCVVTCCHYISICENKQTSVCWLMALISAQQQANDMDFGLLLALWQHRVTEKKNSYIFLPFCCCFLFLKMS